MLLQQAKAGASLWLVAAVALAANDELPFEEEAAIRAAVDRVAPAVVRIEPARAIAPDASTMYPKILQSVSPSVRAYL